MSTMHCKPIHLGFINNPQMLLLFLAGLARVVVSADARWSELNAGQIHWQAPQSSSSRTTNSFDGPAGPLPWSDLNILSTTDSHGWLRGHHGNNGVERLYAADVGDLASFKIHLEGVADRRNVDLLFVDSGDQLDGNGFVDADTSGYKGHAAREILKLLGWDITTTGNHELYNRTVALDVVRNFVPAFDGRYLASNVNISLVAPPSREESVPLGARYRTIVTRNQKRRVTSFGILFNFDRPDRGIYVQSPRDMVKERWWNEALRTVPSDVFILVGHMATRDSDWIRVLRSIRAYHPQTPVLIFSGHAHVRDCVRPDPYSQILAAGRYLETVGFTSAQLSEQAANANRGEDRAQPPLKIARRYLDTNLATYHFHSNTTQADFLQPVGRKMKRMLAAYSASFNLTFAFGTAPQSYYLSRYPTNHPKSLINLYATEVFNTVLTIPKEREGKALPVFLFNTGAARFDIYKGPFTRDDQFTVVPFENGMWYIKDLDYRLIAKVLEYLNNLPGEPEFASAWGDSSGHHRSSLNAKILADSFAATRLRRQQAAAFAAFSDSKLASAFKGQAVPDLRALSYGYVTQDQCGPCLGDDTPHRPLPAFNVPDFVLSTRPEGSARANAEQMYDLVFYEFISPLVLDALNHLQIARIYTQEHIHVYSKLKANELLGEYARIAWSS